MQKVLTAAEMREVDRLTTERYGIPSIILMENAAHAVARVITEKLGGSVKGKTAMILCGPGNNGGDGAALARYFFTQWVDTDVFLFGSIEKTRGDARTNLEIIKRLSERQPPFWPSLSLHETADLDEQQTRACLHHADIVIDALFGTGLSRPLSDSFKSLFELIEDVRSKRENPPLLVSIDLPSGLDADSGSRFTPCFKADVTVTFTAPKTANVLPPSAFFGGELHIGNIGTPFEMTLTGKSELFLSEAVEANNWLRTSRFSDNSYKNKRGHALVIAGSENYSGAAVLAGNAAMRSGVGLVTVATPSSSKDSITSRILSEVMVRGVAETESGAVAAGAFDEIGDLLEKADAVAVGCGLSQDESTREFVKKLVENRRVPTIVDADALNLLSPFVSSPPVTKGAVEPASRSASVEENHPDAEALPLLGKEGSFAPLILTPHEGEFMRLIGEKKNHPDAEASPLLGKKGSLAQDRVAAVREFAQKHNVILVLKGERVLIGEPGGKVVVNPTGNSGLGKAGNGDTLTGILAGFCAQAAAMDIDIFETVVAAVYIAGMAGDFAEKKYGKRVMTASDVRECLSDAFREVGLDNFSG